MSAPLTKRERMKMERIAEFLAEHLEAEARS